MGEVDGSGDEREGKMARRLAIGAWQVVEPLFCEKCIILRYLDHQIRTLTVRSQGREYSEKNNILCDEGSGWD